MAQWFRNNTFSAQVNRTHFLLRRDSILPVWWQLVASWPFSLVTLIRGLAKQNNCFMACTTSLSPVFASSYYWLLQRQHQQHYIPLEQLQSSGERCWPVLSLFCLACSKSGMILNRQDRTLLDQKACTFRDWCKQISPAPLRCLLSLSVCLLNHSGRNPSLRKVKNQKVLAIKARCNRNQADHLVFAVFGKANTDVVDQLDALGCPLSYIVCACYLFIAKSSVKL